MIPLTPSTTVTLAVLAVLAGAPARAADVETRRASATPGAAESTLRFTVERATTEPLNAAAVRYDTVAGTARPGIDFRPASGIAVIPAGQTSTTVEVVLPARATPLDAARTLGLRTRSAHALAQPLDLPAFTAATAGQVGGYVQGFATVDFDGDGRPDLAMANGDTNGVDVLRALRPATAGTLRFAPAQALTAVAGAGRPAACDLNHDGRPDLAVPTSSTNQLSVFINTATAPGTLAFQRTDAVSLPWGWIDQFACADFDGDGRLDLAGAGPGSNVSPGTNRAIVWRNLTEAGETVARLDAPTGWSAHPRNANSSPRHIAVGDFNGDGRPDVALGHTSALDVTVLLNETVAGSGVIRFGAPVAFPTPEPVAGLVALDVDGDGRADLASVNSAFAGGSTWTVFANRTATGAAVADFAPRQFLAGGVPGSVSVADMDLDGRADLVIGRKTTGASLDGSFVVMLNRTAAPGATPTFIVSTQLGGGLDEVGSITAADFDGDGLPDIVAADQVSPGARPLAGFVQSRERQALTVGRGASARLLP